MKQRLLLSLNLLLTLLICVACANSAPSKPFAKGFEGMYVGLLPCADCSGIETHITFWPDSTLALTSHYLDGDETSLTEWGHWAVEERLLRINLEDETTYYFSQLSNQILQMTDSVGYTPEDLAKHYQLHKASEMTATEFAGHYAQGDSTLKDTYVQYLDIEPLESGDLQVVISYRGAGKGCNFIGTGRLVNNQIEVDLSEHHEKFNSTLVVRFTADDTLLVAPSKFEDRYDLMYFCGGGGSLCGTYERADK